MPKIVELPKEIETFEYGLNGIQRPIANNLTKLLLYFSRLQSIHPFF